MVKPLLLAASFGWAVLPCLVGLAVDTIKFARHRRKGTFYRYVNVKFCLATGLCLVGLTRLVHHVVITHGDSISLVVLLLTVSVPVLITLSVLISVALGAAGTAILGLNLTSVAMIVGGADRLHFLGWSEIVSLTTGQDSFWLALFCFLLSTLSGLAGLLYLIRRESLTAETGLVEIQQAIWRAITGTYGRFFSWVLWRRKRNSGEAQRRPSQE